MHSEYKSIGFDVLQTSIGLKNELLLVLFLVPAFMLDCS